MRATDLDPILVFATSDKGGTGRSVTSCNIAYRLWMSGLDVAYVDFDFGSPTAGALFEISGAERGVTEGSGLHSYLSGAINEPVRLNVVRETDRTELRRDAPRGRSLVLLPGEIGGGEFGYDDVSVVRAATLLGQLMTEFDVVIVDLSAGRSAALDIALGATASAVLSNRKRRWLVFHRWTRQHVLAASGLVHGPHGILATAAARGHNKAAFQASMRCVRTAVAESDSTRAVDSAQDTWVKVQAEALQKLANKEEIGAAMLLGQTPIEPMLQWREQIILDNDVGARLANPSTVDAYTKLARHLTDPAIWDSSR
ncbi:SCO2523 family variant P-loop protein [Nocardia sp. NPDC060259]|uniref:SCO2523 family variant P-loop protein n=1 Tax=Nocardia sp. NPDC060259 TaxID=3347088 RepID=UPI003665005A